MDDHFSPSYYTRGKIEVWEFIRDQALNYHLGCALKYICRAGYKENKTDDLKKAIHYLSNELQHTLDEQKSQRSSGRFSPCVPNSIIPGSDNDAEAFDR